MAKKLGLVVAIVTVFLVTGCAPSVNTVASATGAGLLLGLWHGMIAPVTLVLGLFGSNVGCYEVHNTGFGYDFGFLFGVRLLFLIGIRAREALSLSR